MQTMDNVAYDTTVSNAGSLYLPEVVVFPEKKSNNYAFIKRLFDIVFTVLALCVLWPFLLITAAAIKLDSKGPVIYKQQRAARNGRPFKMYKFRSMYSDAEKKLEELTFLNEMDGPVFKMAQDPRVTRVGRFIRRYSIDELPQLINVLQGKMSIVGPRPPLLSEVAQYTPYQMQRLNVIPGLTCYWQISGRSDIRFEEWVALDLLYIRRQSLGVDMRIILGTVPAVLFSKGAY